MFHWPHLFHVPPHLFFHAVAAGVAVVALIFFIGYARWRRHRGGDRRAVGGARNQAFEDYRAMTLRRLESEAQAFRAFRENLRRAADAEAFQNFLARRRDGNGASETPAI
jgi:hypothetical protein